MDKLLLAPRKIYSGVKVLSEADCGLYEINSAASKRQWHG